MDDWTKDRETCERATEGPWANITTIYSQQSQDDTSTPQFYAKVDWPCDAAFIARARERWLPALSRIAALEAERDASFKRGWEAAVEASCEAMIQDTRFCDVGRTKAHTDSLQSARKVRDHYCGIIRAIERR